MRTRVCLISVAIVVKAAVVGCGGGGDGPPRQAVSGKVTLDGLPLDTGQITFRPTGGGDLVAAGAIVNGEYRIPREQGPSPGAHAVSVWSPRPTGKKLPSDDEPGTFIEETRETIPDRYNLKSELTAEVRAGGDNRFDFELKSQPAPSNKRR